MNKNTANSAAHFRAFPQLLLETPLKYGGKTLFHHLIGIGARRFRAGWCHEISISLDPDGTMTVVLHGEILPPAELEQLTQEECGDLNEAQLNLLKIIAFSSAAEFRFPDEYRKNICVLKFSKGKFVSRQMDRALYRMSSSLTVKFLPDPEILGDCSFTPGWVQEYLRHNVYFHTGLPFRFNGVTYCNISGPEGLFRECFPDAEPAFTWQGRIFEFTIGRSMNDEPGRICSFAGAKRTPDGGVHVEGFRQGMTDAFFPGGPQYDHQLETLFRDWNAVVVAHVDEPMFETGMAGRLGGAELQGLFRRMTEMALTEWLSRQKKDLETEKSVEKKGPMMKKKTSTHCANLSRGGIERWFDQVMEDPGLLEDRECPLSRFSVEQWKELILRHPEALQFNPPEEELLTCLTKEDFKDWDGCQICSALFMDGGWLAKLLPMENIGQEDFDSFFGELAFPTAEEFWDVVPEYFPTGFPPHLKLPYAKPKKKKQNRK